MNIITAGQVRELNELHAEIIGDVCKTLDKVITLGGMLSDARDNVPEGEWEDWIEDNLEYSSRTARRYLDCWESRKFLKKEKIEGINEAYALLSNPPVPPKTSPVAEQKQPIGQSVRSNSTSVPNGKPEPTRMAVAKAVKVAEAPEILDEIGRPVPEAVLPLWNRQQEVQDLLTLTAKLRTALRKAQKEGDILFAEVRFQDSISRLDTIYYNLRCCMPYAVCPYCQGVTKDCKFCAGRGYIGKDTWDGPIPMELKELCFKEVEKRKAINV